MIDYVFDGEWCIGYMDGERLVRFIWPLPAHTVAGS